MNTNISLPDIPSPYAGQWYVAAFSTALKQDQILIKLIADQEIVFWRDTNTNMNIHTETQSQGFIQAASAVCPHWGGPLQQGHIGSVGELVCPWHGWQFKGGACLTRPRLKLPRYLAYDDGLLLWVRLPWDVDEINEPPLQQRPAHSRPFWFEITIDSDVYHVQENYLDFLHPAEYHTTVFNQCTHLGREGEINLVELGYKLPFGRTMRTRTRVWAPTPYQVRNEVYEGLGIGMVIESHLTPIRADQTIIHEIYHTPSTIVPSIGWPFVRHLMQKGAQRIRQEDALFSARRYQLRKQGFVDGRGLPIQGQITPYVEAWEESAAAAQSEQKLADLVGKKAISHW